MLDKIKTAIKYDPETGSFTRLTRNAEKAYLHPNPTGAPRVSVLGMELSSRSLAWFLMTGYYPNKYEVESLDGNLSNIKWANLRIAEQGHKFCSKCKKEKPLAEFAKNKARKAGIEPACKACRRHNAKVYARKTNMKNFGLTVELYNKMLAEQDNVCAICKNTDASKRLAVDHCHNTNKIRGLLCSRCNQGLGLFKDNTVLLSKAIQYLSS